MHPSADAISRRSFCTVDTRPLSQRASSITCTTVTTSQAWFTLVWYTASTLVWYPVHAVACDVHNIPAQHDVGILVHARPSTHAHLPFLHLSPQAKRDWFFIAMPNAMGVAFNFTSLILCTVLPARDRQSSEPCALSKVLQNRQGSTATEAAPSEASDSHEIDLAVEAVSQHPHTK